DVPRLVSEKGAVVKCRAEWKQEGTSQVLEREFAIRVNSGMGTDAIIGKATRKLYAAICERLSGKVTPEGEAGEEAIEVKATVTTAPATADELFKGQKKDSAAPTNAAPQQAEATTATPPKAEDSAAEAASETYV